MKPSDISHLESGLLEPGQELLLLPGAMKSGTTSLFGHLAVHPAVAVHREKEPNFFCAPASGPQALQAYLAQFSPRRAGTRYFLDASTRYAKPYFDIEATARRIGESGFPVRLLFIARDPIERIESHIRQHYRERRFDGDIRPEFLNNYFQASLYGYQMSVYLRLLEEPRLHIVDFDMFTRAPDPATRRIETFLELEPGSLPRRPVHWGRSSEEQLRMDVLGERRIAVLRDRLAPDMSLFHRLTGFDVSRWGF